jgi:lambda family phage minor tail protein L
MAYGDYAIKVNEVQFGAVGTDGTTGISAGVTYSTTLDGRPLDNRLVWVSVHGYKNAGGGDPSFTVTFDGVTMNSGTGLVSAPLGGNARLYSQDFWLPQSSLPTFAGTKNVVVTYSGGPATMNLLAGYVTFANVDGESGVITSQSTAVPTPATSVSLSLPHPANDLTIMSGSHNGQGTVGNVTHNNFQQEVIDYGLAGGIVQGFSTFVNVDQSVATPFSTFSGGTVLNWTKQGIQFNTIQDKKRYFATTLSATSSVTSQFAGGQNRYQSSTIVTSTVTNRNFQVINVPIAAAIAATSTTAADLLRDRGYVTTVPALTTTTTSLVRSIKYQTLVTNASTVTVQPFERSAKLRTLLEPMSDITVDSAVTRPLSTVINAQSALTVTFGNTFAETGYSMTPGDYVELFEIDTTVIGGSDVFRFIPHRFETPDVQVQWKGQTFILFPVEADGFETSATGQAPPQPTLRVANVNKFILAAVLELGDIIGAKVTRWRTYARFLDNGETPDPSAHYAPDIYYIQQKSGHNREGFEFTLSSALDLPGIKLPRRQILKDQSSDDRNLYAPGVANVRFRGR